MKGIFLETSCGQLGKSKTEIEATIFGLLGRAKLKQ
jgi:hypothetical protein